MNKILTIIISFIFVFNQVFLFDSFETKFGLIFVPMLYYFFKNNFESVKIYTLSLFLLSGLLQNVSSLLAVTIFFIGIDLLIALGKNINFLTLEYYLVGLFIITYYLFYSSILSFSFLFTISSYLVLILIRFIRRNGYFRFN